MSQPPSGPGAAGFLVLAGLGIATSLLVSWGFAFRDLPAQVTVGCYGRQPGSQFVPLGPSASSGQPNALVIEVYQGCGAVMYSATAYGPLYVSGTRPLMSETYLPTSNPAQMVAPWSIRRVLPWLTHDVWPAGGADEWRCTDARGWPLVCFSNDYYITPTLTHGARGGLQVHGDRTRRYGSFTGRTELTQLPFIPIWSNLAIDSAFYAGAWFLLLLVPRFIRAVHRRRRGHCPSCGYNLSATPIPLPCPECGHTRNPPTSNR